MLRKAMPPPQPQGRESTAGMRRKESSAKSHISSRWSREGRHGAGRNVGMEQPRLQGAQSKREEPNGGDLQRRLRAARGHLARQLLPRKFNAKIN